MQKLTTMFVALALLAAGVFTVGASPADKKKQSPKFTVLLFLSTDCPVAMRYSPRINAMVKQFGEQGVEFKSYFPNDMETQTSIKHYCSDRQYKFSAELDLAGQKAKSLGVKVIPAAVVLDANGKKVYEGAIDDHKDPTLVKKRFLAESLTALVAGKPSPFKKTDPFGCVLMARDVPPAISKVTYAEHVKPILDRACLKCHRPNEVAPFSLVGYENASKWSPMIQLVTASRRMPPWKAVHGYNMFRDENRLTEVEIETLKRWDEAGAPRGDKSKEAADPVLPSSEWPLGQPDIILSPEKAYTLEADGADVYRHYALKTNFKETKWIKGMWVQPGNKKVVHHVIAFLDERGQSHKLDGADGQIGYTTFGGPGILPDGSIGGWAPGLNSMRTPEGIAFELKPGTTVLLEVHYHKTGKPETDLTKLGLYFADEKKETIDQAMSLAWLANFRIRIPAGDESSVQEMSFPIPADVTVYSAMPHMHLLAKSMRADIEYPDGTVRPLVFVDDYDFNWQLNYTLTEPMKIPKGSKLHMKAIYDNSPKNKNNPSDPPRPVRWGEQTTDEMMLLIVSYTVDGAKRPAKRMIGFGGNSDSGN